MRHQYWYKYVVRYRAIREWLNSSISETISIYDLTNHYGQRPGRRERVKNSFLKLEPSLLSVVMIVSAIIAYTLVPTNA